MFVLFWGIQLFMNKCMICPQYHVLSDNLKEKYKISPKQEKAQI